MARLIGDGHLLCHALRHLGITLGFQGDQTGARAMMEEALAVAREVGDTREASFALLNLGQLALDNGDHATAGGLLAEGLALARQVGDLHVIGGGLLWLGRLAMEEGDLGRARSFFGEVLGRSRSIGHSIGHLYAQSFLGEISRREGDFARARGLIQAALLDVRRIEEVAARGSVLKVAAGIEIDSGRPAVAVRLLAAIEAAWRRAGFARSNSYTWILHEQHLASARMVLDGDAFAAAWAEGQAMTLEQAIDLALADSGPADEPTAEEAP
jgi:tetratricopeptide (TPR) repeat protein